MFGFGKKPSREDTILVGLKAAVVCWQGEKKNGGVYTPPEIIQQVTSAVAKRDGVPLEGRALEVAVTCAMNFLMEQKFVDRILVKSRTGDVGTFSPAEEQQINAIVGMLFP